MDPIDENEVFPTFPILSEDEIREVYLRCLSGEARPIVYAQKFCNTDGSYQVSVSTKASTVLSAKVQVVST